MGLWAQNQWNMEWPDINPPPLYAVRLVDTNSITYQWAKYCTTGSIPLGLQGQNQLNIEWPDISPSPLYAVQLVDTNSITYRWAKYCTTGSIPLGLRAHNQLNIEWPDISPSPLYAVRLVDTNSITYQWAKYFTTSSIPLGLWAQNQLNIEWPDISPSPLYVVYGDLPQQAGKGMGMHQKCFGNLPLPTDGCAEVHPYPRKSVQKFTLTYRCMSPKVWACAENVSVIYHCLPMDVRRCIHAHGNRFSDVP